MHIKYNLIERLLRICRRYLIMTRAAHRIVIQYKYIFRIQTCYITITETPLRKNYKMQVNKKKKGCSFTGL